MANGTTSAGDSELQRKIEEYRARERIYQASVVEQQGQLSQLKRMAADVLEAYGDVSRAQIRGGLSDPTQNMEVLLLRRKAFEKDQQIRQLREELEANRFDQQSSSGRVLMERCRSLLQENAELGDQIGEARMQELRSALAAEQRVNAEQLQKCIEASEFCKELAQENDKLQGTVSKVAGKLREAMAEQEQLRQQRAEAKAKRKRDKEVEKTKQAAPPVAPATVDLEASPPAAAATPASEPEATAPAVAIASGSPEVVAEKPDKEKKAKKAKKSKTATVDGYA